MDIMIMHIYIIIYDYTYTVQSIHVFECICIYTDQIHTHIYIDTHIYIHSYAALYMPRTNVAGQGKPWNFMFSGHA